MSCSVASAPHVVGKAPDSMRAAVVAGVGSVAVRRVAVPQVGAHDVLVRVAAVGLCGTDLHIFLGHANYNTDAGGHPVPLCDEPQVLGHEITGMIIEAGAQVTDLSAGDRVVIDQGLNCRSARRTPACEYCAGGDSHQCEFYREHGITGLQGGLAEMIAVPAVNAVKITSGIAPEAAAFAEPLGCIIHSIAAVIDARSRYRLGTGSEPGKTADAATRNVRTILVCGAGPAGLLFIQYLRRVLGFDGTLLVSEPHRRKRELAASFGAEPLNAREGDLVGVVRERTGGRMVELLIEASGSSRSFELIPALIRKQATVLLYGHGHAGADLSLLNNLMFKEPTLVTPVGASGGFDRDGRPIVYRQALDLIERRQIEVAALVSHRYSSLDELPRAFADAQHAPDFIKGVVLM